MQALAVAARARRKLALLYSTSTDSRRSTTSLGHRGGDELLKALSERLSATVRGGDTVARLGGDEFAVIQVELRTAPDAAILAERLMAAWRHPCGSANRGGDRRQRRIALFPDDGSTADELRANADVALYSAKSSGRSRMAYYRPELTQEVRARGRCARACARDRGRRAGAALSAQDLLGRRLGRRARGAAALASSAARPARPPACSSRWPRRPG